MALTVAAGYAGKRQDRYTDAKRKEKIMPSFECVIPVLTYRDIPAAYDFLVDAFGFHGEGVHRDTKGQAVHGEIRAGAATIWLHRVAMEHQLNSPVVANFANSGLFVRVDDVDAHYERARAAGAIIDSPPIDQPCLGQREYGARDTEGHRWWFASRVEATERRAQQGPAGTNDREGRT